MDVRCIRFRSGAYMSRFKWVHCHFCFPRLKTHCVHYAFVVNWHVFLTVKLSFSDTAKTVAGFSSAPVVR